MALAYFRANHFKAEHFLALYTDAVVLGITDTDVLQKPINCVLIGHQPYKESGREWDLRPMQRKEKATVTRSRAQKLSGGPPSFTVKTGNRGYD